MRRKVLYIYIYIISNVSNENSTSFFKNSKGKFVKIFFLIKIIKGKLQLTYMWFDWNLSCLPVVWNLTLYLLEVSLIRFLKSISVKTKVKYVLLLHFYVSFLQKHKNTRSNKKKKKIQQNTCIMRFQITGWQLKFQSNLRWVKL